MAKEDNANNVKLVRVSVAKCHNLEIGKIRGLHIDHQKFKNIVFDMEHNGYDLTKPITVTPLLDPATKQVVPDQWRIIDGQHRHAAAVAALGETFEIPAFIDESLVNEEPIQFKIRMLRGNQFIPTTLKEEADFVKTLAAEMGYTQADIAELLGREQGQVSALLKFDKFSPDIQVRIKQGKIVTTNALALATIPQQFQEQFVEKAENMGTTEFRQEIQERRKEFAVKGRTGEALDENVIVPKFVGMTEAKIKLEQEKRRLAKVDPNNAEEYRYFTGRKDMLEELLQIDAHTIQYKQASKDKDKLEKQLAGARKRREAQENTIRELEQRKAAELENVDENAMSIA